VIKINRDKAKNWLDKGAKPSERVKFLFEKEGILEPTARTKASKEEENSESTTENKADSDKK